MGTLLLSQSCGSCPSLKFVLKAGMWYGVSGTDAEHQLSSIIISACTMGNRVRYRFYQVN